MILTANGDQHYSREIIFATGIVFNCTTLVKCLQHATETETNSLKQWETVRAFLCTLQHTVSTVQNRLQQLILVLKPLPSGLNFIVSVVEKKVIIMLAIKYCVVE